MSIEKKALELCGDAAAGRSGAWPEDMHEKTTGGTPLEWRVNRIGEIIRAVDDGTFNGRETPAFAGYYKYI